MADLGGSSSQEIAGSSDLTFEINVKTLDSRIYKFRVTENMSVPTFKTKIANATGTPVEQQRLIFRGKVLKDDKHLSDYHLEEGHTLHLVARQPAQAQPEPGTTSGDPSRASGNQGHDPASNVPRSRVGPVSHSVVVGTVNVADQGEGMMTDISRVVGAVLQSIGAGMVAPSVRANNMTTASNQDPPNGESDGLPNSSSRTHQGDMAQPTVPVGNQPFQIPLFSTGPMPLNMGISDSLTTLSDFINRMELILQNSGSQSSAQSNVQNPPRSENPSPQPNGIPTPDMLCSVIDHARQLLSGAVATSFANMTEHVRREISSSDPRVRSRVQAEAMNLAVVMQHLGSMLLELGRTTMMLRMGSSPGQSFVNAGPAVYISSMGPNPLMVQPFPTQANSLFTASPSPVGGHSGLPGASGLLRNINVHILSGSPLGAGASSSVLSTSRLGNNAENHDVEQTTQPANVSGNAAPRLGMPARTVVASVPGRSNEESSSHALGVVYPVHVLSQQSASTPLAASQGFRPSGTGGAQSNTPVLEGSFLESDNIPAIVAQINSNLSNILAGNASGNFLSSASMQSFNAHSSHSTADGDSQSYIASSTQNRSSEGQNLMPMNIMPSNVSVPHIIASGLPSSIVNENTDICMADGAAEVGSLGNNDRLESHILDTCFQGVDENKTTNEGHEFFDTADRNRSLDLVGSSSNSSRSQAGDTSSTVSLEESSGKNMGTTTTSQGSSSQCEESKKPMPLGLGLGGLQLKKRSKSTKSIQKDDTSTELSSNKHNQESIARGQEVLQSLFARGSDVDRARLNGPSDSNHSSIARIMNDTTSGGGSSGQADFGNMRGGSSGQVDLGNMMSSVLRSPAFSNLLTNVAEQTGLGSPADVRSMMEQCTRNPAIRNTLNEIVHQAEGQDQEHRPMLFGSGRGEGGIDFSRMIQQLMPVVSQAFGRGSTHSAPFSSGSEPQHLGNHMPHENDRIHDGTSQMDLCKVREGIERQDLPTNIFPSVLDGLQRMYGESNNFRELIEELGNNMELSDEYAEVLRRHLSHRLEKQSGNEERS